MGVPLFDPATPLAGLRRRLAKPSTRSRSRAVILGPGGRGLRAGARRVPRHRPRIGVANGTEALTIALRALGVGPGDDVVVPSFSFYASAEAIPPTGARPVFCDVDRDTYCATPDTVRAALTPRTKAVIVVDSRQPRPRARDRGARRPVTEDAAQAVGSDRPDGRRRAGHARDASLPSKNLGAFGDGARSPPATRPWPSACCCASTARATRSATRRWATTSRLDELQAAILRVQLPELERWAAHRYGVGERTRRRSASSSAPGRPRRLAPRVARLRRPPRTRRRSRRRSARPSIGARLLPHADPPPAGDGRLRAPDLPATASWPAPPGPAGVRGHAPRPGRRGRRRRAPCGSGLT